MHVPLSPWSLNKDTRKPNTVYFTWNTSQLGIAFPWTVVTLWGDLLPILQANCQWRAGEMTRLTKLSFIPQHPCEYWMWRCTYKTRAGETETERNRKPKVKKIRNNAQQLILPSTCMCTRVHMPTQIHSHTQTNMQIAQWPTNPEPNWVWGTHKTTPAYT